MIPDSVPKWVYWAGVVIVVGLIVLALSVHLDAATALLPGVGK